MDRTAGRAIYSRGLTSLHRVTRVQNEPMDPAQPVNPAQPADPAGLGSRDRSSPRADLALTIVTYVVLVLFGMAQALLGTFFYGSGPAPLAAIGFDVAILATCLLGSWGTGRASGAFAAAAGWYVVTFILASGTKGGSVLITASIAGETFLFGGAAAAMIGLIIAFTVWSRARIRSRYPR
jgi:hypothetical protein